MNSRFAFAVYVLGFMAFTKGRPSTSEAIAQSLNTNPVVVRRVLGVLREAGLVETRLGTGGGALLARDASAISLLDVYEALEGEDSDLFALQSLHPAPCCHVGPIVQAVLERFFGEAETAMRQQLAQVTVAQVVQEVGQRLGRCPGP